MFRNYFKTAWRGMARKKVYTTINIAGLATGMAVALLIGFWVQYQYSFDRFLPDYGQIYQVRYQMHDNGVTSQTAATAAPLADALKKNIPGVQYAVQTDWTRTHGLAAGDKKLSLAGTMVGADFLRMFRYPFVKGDADLFFKDPYSILLTQSTATALFGKENPINKTVKVDNRNDLRVVGVLEDIPANSTFQFHYLIPFAYYVATENWVKEANTNWENAFLTYVALQPGVSYGRVEAALRLFFKQYSDKRSTTELIMQPMKDWHLYSDFTNGVATGGLIDYIRMFAIIGILILVIACINFMNLSTARSEKRAKEVGIRKVVGSSRSSLIVQFLVEAIATVCIALLLALLLVQLALPAFNGMADTALHIPYTNVGFWCVMLGYAIVTGLLAGSRPAFYLASFNAVDVLKGAARSMKAGWQATLSRKVLVVGQFSCTIALIIAAVVVYQQIDYARNRPTGFDTNRLMMTDASADLSRNYYALKNELLQTGVVSNVTKASGAATELNQAVGVDEWNGKLPGEVLVVNVVAVSDRDYFNTLGMQFLQGENFRANDSANTSYVILNEAAVRRLRLTNPTNQLISFWGGPQKVIGVVRDALMTSPFAAAEPIFFTFHPRYNRTTNSVMYRLSPTVNTQAAISKLAPIFNKYNPAYPYEYRFADDSYAAKFKLEVLIGQLAGLFAALAIYISCLGLLGLSAYMAKQRTKEIGIRKVLGASVAELWLLLSKEFMVLVMISCIIAVPVAFYYLHGWLQQYDYRITISPMVFVIAAVAAMMITVVTISFQTVRAALANPVDSLRSE